MGGKSGDLVGQERVSPKEPGVTTAVLTFLTDKDQCQNLNSR